MRKNRIFSVLSGAALLLAAGACSNETLLPDNNEPGKLGPDGTGGVYMSIDFTMPNGKGGTRSETTGDGGSTGGIEVGSDEENYVSSALIVLASSEAKGENLKKYGFIVAGEVRDNRIATVTSPVPEGSKQYRATARLQKENLNSFYSLYWNENADNGEGEAKGKYEIPPVCVFVFCNPTKDLIDLFSDSEVTPFGSSDWIEKTCEVIQGENPEKNVGIWSANSFLMNNVEIAERLLPEKLLDWEYFTSVEKPFHLSWTQDIPEVKVDNLTDRGAVKVERSVARFDFKDGSVKDGNHESIDKEDNTYDVLFLTNEKGDIEKGSPIVKVQLQKMCLVNMSKSFYYLPRVSDNGMPNGENLTLLGKEKPWIRNNGLYSGGNYVVGPNAMSFADGVSTDFSNFFNYAFFEKDGTFNNPDNNADRWNVVKISDVLAGHKDNYEGTDDNKIEKGSYRVWRYVTENVIPAGTENQQNGISTGVVFKGKMNGTSIALAGKDSEDKGLYEEYWNKGYISNLAKCLNGEEEFTYNGNPHTTLSGTASKDPILYYFSGRLYMGWRHIRQAAIQASITKNVSGELEINRSNSLYKAVFGDGPIPAGMVYIPNVGTAAEPEAGAAMKIEDPTWPLKEEDQNENNANWVNYLNSPNYAWIQWAGEEEKGDDTTGGNANKYLTDMRLAVTGAGITIFQSSIDDVYGPGYYCYYYYWNRHNDNGFDGTMGPMEFDVVRNNVYKLSVDKIARLGHPRIPENDPNNPTPDTPDESDEIYLDVRVQIVPWAVRVNGIRF